MKPYSFKPKVGPWESSTQREDMILIKGKFYYIDDTNLVQFFVYE